MPKTLLEKIVFTIIMAAIMVYGMIVYNVALNTGGVTNASFAMALHEMPIMVPAAFILEFSSRVSPFSSTSASIPIEAWEMTVHSGPSISPASRSFPLLAVAKSSFIPT